MHITKGENGEIIPVENEYDLLEFQQRIEGSSLKRIDLRTLPRWLVVFFYFFSSAMVCMLLFGLVMSFIK